MIRTLGLIAVSGFVLAVACLAGAGALGWHGMIHRHWPGWNVNFDDHDGIWRFGRHWSGDVGPQTTREIAWTGGDSLDIDLPADVQFTQGTGPAKLVITGPKDVVDSVALDGGNLRLDNDIDFGGPVKVVMTAPQVRHFNINGVGHLAIDGFNQDELDVTVSGAGGVKASGKAHALKLEISGNGDADLGGIAADSAEADISGAGHAVVAPTSAADLRISGAGEIELKTHPAKLNTDITGLGRIVTHDDGGAHDTGAKTNETDGKAD